jgi:hypothetical protein
MHCIDLVRRSILPVPPMGAFYRPSQRAETGHGSSPSAIRERQATELWQELCCGAGALCWQPETLSELHASTIQAAH